MLGNHTSFQAHVDSRLLQVANQAWLPRFRRVSLKHVASLSPGLVYESMKLNSSITLEASTCILERQKCCRISRLSLSTHT